MAKPTKNTLCSCGAPTLYGRSVCKECNKTKKRERYAQDEVYRNKLIQKAKDTYDPEKRQRLYHYYKQKAFEVLGGYCCKSCGFDDPRALQIDHIDNDGYAKRKSGEVGKALYKLVVDTNGIGFQVLCANCNWIKKAEAEGITLEYYWEGELDEFKPNLGRPCSVRPEDTYATFATEEPAGNVASRLHVSKTTLRDWWLTKFGKEAVLKRSRYIQAKAVQKTGTSLRGKHYALGSDGRRHLSR